MSRCARMMLLGLISIAVVAASGCAEKEQPVVTGPDQSALDAERRIADLDALLQQAQRERAASEENALRLQNELNRLREQLAQRAEKPSPAPGWDSVPGGAMTSIEGTILFDSGKAALKPTARKTLEDLSRVIRRNFPDHDVYVFGHTDNVPIRYSGWKDNYELSCQRALSVVRFLQSAAGGQNMAACGWGDRKPVTRGSSPQALQANRRVEIFAMARQPAESGATEGAPPSPEE